MAKASRLAHRGRRCCSARHDDRRTILSDPIASLASPLPFQPSRGTQRTAQVCKVCERNPPTARRRRSGERPPIASRCHPATRHLHRSWHLRHIAVATRMRRHSPEFSTTRQWAPSVRWTGTGPAGSSGSVVESSSNSFESLVIAQSTRRVIAVACTVNVVCIIVVWLLLGAVHQQASDRTVL